MSAIPGLLRQTLRRMSKEAGFTAIVIMTLALGIGANTTIFSVVNAVLLRPLPYPDADRIVQLNHFYRSLNNLEANVSARGYDEYRRRATSFDALSAQALSFTNLTGRGEPERLFAAAVTTEFFGVYGVRPAIGRAFTESETQSGGARVAILTHGLWQRLFGGAPSVLGQTVVLGGEPHEVVGVMPASWRDAMVPIVELYTPLALTPEQVAGNLTSEWLLVMGRLRPGVTVDGARREMSGIAEQILDELQLAGEDWTVIVTALDARTRATIRPALVLLLGAVGLVLLIACVNVANLLLARGAGRVHEVAIRSALGASRAQIVRLLLGESMLVAIAGGALGLLLAVWGVQLVGQQVPEHLSGAGGIAVDTRVLLFTLALSVLSGLLFGTAPAAQAIRRGAKHGIHVGVRGGSDGSAHRVRRGLVVAELALALTLLVGAGLLLRSFARVQAVDPGLRPDGVLTFTIAIPPVRYESNDQRIGFLDALHERFAALPGVTAAGATTLLPFSGDIATRSFLIEGMELAENQPMPWGEVRDVSPGYLDALGIRLVRGRFIEEHDRMGAPRVAVIDEEFVRRFFRDSDPIGRRVAFPTAPNVEPLWREIVGVVAHTKHDGLEADGRIQLYLPYRQSQNAMGLVFALRTGGDPYTLVPAVRDVVRGLDPDQPLHRVTTMPELMRHTLAQRRFTLTLLGAFAALALLLAALGIYGVMAQLVTERRIELGVRMALGAATGDVLRLVMRQGFTLTAIGIVLGAAGAAALAPLLRSQLFETGVADPVTFAAVAVVLAGASLLATALPAWRAAQLEPTVALRQE